MMEDFIVLHYLFLYGVTFICPIMTCLFLILWYLLYSHKKCQRIFLQMDSALQDIHCYLE